MKVRLTTVLLALAVELVQSVAVTDLFNVDQASCGQYLSAQGNGPSVLQQFVDEAAAMATAGRRMYSQINRPNPTRWAQAYDAGFWKSLGGGASDRNFIASALGRTADFLANNVQPSGNQYKAQLYCNDNYFQKRSPRNQAVQINGQPATDANGNAVSIQSLYSRQISSNTENGVFPDVFLVDIPATANSPEIYQYFFFRAYDGQRVCSGGTLGETFVARPPNAPVPIIVLCMSSFDYGRTATLTGQTLQPAQPGTRPTQGLDTLTPYSLTLLHELYHYCPYNPITGDGVINDVATQSNADPYSLRSVLRNALPEARENAENYALFSLASWFTFNQKVTPPGGQQSAYVSFASGRCTYL